MKKLIALLTVLVFIFKSLIRFIEVLLEGLFDIEKHLLYICRNQYISSDPFYLLFFCPHSVCIVICRVLTTIWFHILPPPIKYIQLFLHCPFLWSAALASVYRLGVFIFNFYILCSTSFL